MSTIRTGKADAAETLKAESRHLRGTIAAELTAAEPGLSKAAEGIVKFHGSYLQKDREAPRAEALPVFMVRGRIPGGVLSAEQYLVYDRLAREHGNQSLRLTTRQGIQLHGIVKGELKATIRAINDALSTTNAACGDVVRNVMVSPAPPADAAELEVLEIARQIGSTLLPRSNAYNEIWLDGEQVNPEDERETVYGETYLPRKFKIGVAVSREGRGDNSVDVFTQDIGLIARVIEGHLVGFVVLAGGGLGVTPSRDDTFPRLADVVTFAKPGEVLEVVTEIVKIQRDFGNRGDRKRARLKYLIADRGVAWFRDELSQRLEREIPEAPSVPPLQLALHHGWTQQADGRWALGLFIENGRIKNDGDRRVLDGLRAIIAELRPEVRLTPHQDLILANIDAALRPRVEELLAEHGVAHASAYRAARRHSMACPALPFCSQAITDAERALPEVMDRLEASLVRLGLDGDAITVRMTGCPNGCARPYVSDIGLVGRSIGAYAVYLGGSASGTRLNTLLQDRVPEASVVSVLEPILAAWRDARQPGEGFGDYVHRVGIARFQEVVA